MKTTARAIFSATAALGLSALTLISACTAGASASFTATTFGLLAIFGLIEMMILAYAPCRPIMRPATLHVVTPYRSTAQVPTVVEFPSRAARACAA